VTVFDGSSSHLFSFFFLFSQFQRQNNTSHQQQQYKPATLMANPLNMSGKAKGGGKKKKWKKGDSCEAPFADYGDYPAKVVRVSGSNAVVIFDGYDDEETVPLSSMK
tara:strand:+ start:188 stop:508 length:321 start_codon:yes stop_codon:yes gene_type:complete